MHSNGTKVLCALLMVTVAANTLAADDLTVLSAGPDASPPSRMGYQYLQGIANAALDRREARIATLKMPEEIAAYQQEMKDLFVSQLGGFPERTPLNPRVVGTIEKDGYRVEKIIFESRPNFFVTGLLYLPAAPGPHAAVLMPCGHSKGGKDSEAYQTASILLATNGIASFLYDPIGQGERYQILNAEGKPIHPPVTEHTFVGVGSILVGLNTANYRIWDGMRAIDYLCSREDIDASRIGCSGNSGGGTLTSYLMALDERIVCAAPSCYLVGFRTLIDTIGPQDAEQNIYGQIAAGLDHRDYVLMRAPEPTLMLCATEDFFDIESTWRVYREAKRFYARLDLPERISLAEAEAPHGYSRTLRQAMVQWMRRWLLGKDGPILEPADIKVLTAEEVQCTPEGQVLLMEGARSVLDLNLQRAEQLAEQRSRLWNGNDKQACLDKVRAVAGIRRLADLPEPAVESAGTIQRNGYKIDKLILTPEKGIRLPALAFVPEQPATDAVLYLHGQGKQADAAPGGPIEQLVSQGKLVLAVDIRGIGETAPSNKRYASLARNFGENWQEVFLAYMLGKSYVGMRAEDVLSSARFLAGYGKADGRRQVHLIASGECTIPALHAAALEPQLFASAKLEEVMTWTQLLHSPQAKGQFPNVIHDVLGAYDVDNLLASLPAGMLIDAAGQE